MSRIACIMTMLTVGLPDPGGFRFVPRAETTSSDCCCCGPADQCRCDCSGSPAPNGAPPATPAARFCGCDAGNDGLLSTITFSIQKPRPCHHGAASLKINMTHGEWHGLHLHSRYTGPPPDANHLSTIILVT